MTLFSTDSQRFKDLTANYDSRKFPLCAPHDGTKGLAFQRFANDFLIAIAAIDLKDPNETYDLSETLVGIDEGGSVAPPGQAAPIPMGTSQTAARRRTKRLKLAFAHLYQHITDLTLRKMLGDPSGPCLDGASIGIQTFSGWKGTRPCRCRRESGFLNCDVRSESGRRME